MSVRLWSGLVILKDHGADVDLSKKWTVIEYEDGSPQSVIITLNAARGRFITQGTKIQKWDRLYVEITDQLGNTVKDVFHVNLMRKQRKHGKGLQLILHCPHQSSNLLKQTISKPGRRSSGVDAMNDIVSQLNSNKGSSDPTVETVSPFNITTKLGNNLDPGTTNDYIFESVKARTAIDEIIQREGTPVEVGGSFQFHYFRFKSKYNHGTGLGIDTVYLQVFQQGFMDNGAGAFTNVPQVTLTKPTLESGLRANTLALDTEMEVEKGTNNIAIGNRSSGSYPTAYSKFIGAKTVFENANRWEDTREYIEGTLVTWEVLGSVLQYECILDNIANLGVNDPTTGAGTFWAGPYTFLIPITWAVAQTIADKVFREHNGICYESIQAHTASSANEPPNTAFWKRISWFTPNNYSPLTKANWRHWLNAGGGSKYYADVGFKNNVGVVDPAVIVKDFLHPRTWVDAVYNDSVNLLSQVQLLQGGKPFDGFRCLVVNPTTGVSTGLGDFAGNDKNGIPMGGNIVEWRDPQLTNPSTTGEWVVFKECLAYDDFEVFDFETSTSWTNNPCEPTVTLGIADRSVNQSGACVFVLGGSAPRQTVWKKGAYRISQNVDGPIGRWFLDGSFECFHAYAWDTGAVHSKIGNEQLGVPNTDSLFVEYGSSDSAVYAKFDPTIVIDGEFKHFAGLNFAFPWPRQNTGGQTIGSEIDLPTFDLDNMHLTHNRSREWFGPDVEDFYPIQSFDFMQFFRHQVIVDWAGGINGPKSDGDYSFALWLCDRSDNVITIDYTHSHNNNAFPQSMPIGKQKIYRAVPGTSIFVASQRPEILDVFDFRNVIRGGIYTKDSFDEQNRYKGTTSRFWKATELKLSIDGFKMTKPLVCTNADEPAVKDVRNIEPSKFQWEKITNYAQLKNYILAQASISGFRTDRYQVTSPGRCNIAFGDPVYYNDPEAIDETTLGNVNTIRATANTITYSLSKGADGPGGFTRTVDLVTRLYPDETP